MSDAVRIKGLAELQRDLRAIQPATRREVTKTLREGAKVVYRAGKPMTARKSGNLQRGWTAGANLMQGYVRNRLPYAGVLEFGGTIRPRGTEFRIDAQPSMTKALRDKQDRIIESVGDAVEQVAVRHGWR